MSNYMYWPLLSAKHYKMLRSPGLLSAVAFQPLEAGKLILLDKQGTMHASLMYSSALQSDLEHMRIKTMLIDFRMHVTSIYQADH